MTTKNLQQLTDRVHVKIALFKLTKHIKADLEQALAKTNTGITLLQFGVIALLKKYDATMNELAAELSVKPPSLVPVIDHLVELKLIKRNPDTHDRRKIQLTLTTHGASICEKVRQPEGTDTLSKALKALGEEKTNQLIMLLSELTQHFIK